MNYQVNLSWDSFLWGRQPCRNERENKRDVVKHVYFFVIDFYYTLQFIISYLNTKYKHRQMRKKPRVPLCIHYRTFGRLNLQVERGVVKKEGSLSSSWSCCWIFLLLQLTVVSKSRIRQVCSLITGYKKPSLDCNFKKGLLFRKPYKYLSDGKMC